MKTNWLIFIALIVATSFLAGCPPPPESTEAAAAAKAEAEQKAVEKMAEAGDLAVNPDVLPPPRPAMDIALDLSNAVLVVNDATLARMEAEGVPSDVLSGLNSLQGKEFTNAAEFIAAVRSAQGNKADASMDAIVRNALVMTLASSAQPPQGEMSLAERQEAKMAMSEFKVVFFDFDKSDIKPEFASAIAENAEALMADPNLSVTIEGHADERGTNEYNLALGQRRAEATRRALINKGVNSGQLKTVSFGEERPVALGSDEESWAQNRRSVIVSN